MICPNCFHLLNAADKRCIYCGAPVDGKAPDAPVCEPAAEQSPPVPPDPELPDPAGKLFENIFQTARAERRRTKRKPNKQPLAVETAAPGRVLSLDEIYNVLTGMRDAFENGFSEYAAYRRMAADIIKEHLLSLTDDVRVQYMISEIKETKLGEFIDEEMYSTLVYFAVSTVIKKPDIKWKRRRKSWFFSS